VIPLSSADTTAPPTAGSAEDTPADDTPHDDRREALLNRITDALGAAVVGSHIRPGHGLWVRVTRDAWFATGETAKHQLGLRFFDFLSGIDWLPSPFARDMDSQEDVVVHGRADKDPLPMVSGFAGGDTRFQVFSRLYSTADHIGVVFKADLPADDPSVASWVPLYHGASWHERECREMYGFDFIGHPNLIKLYLPTDFEGYPLRKDFPLLARRVKPWPGIVDVEPMPGEDEAAGATDETGEPAP
jgi:NADH-quinone oxidoreductase subunit C